MLDCDGRVVPGDAAYKLYVFWQSEWRPKQPNSRGAFLLAAGDHLDLLLRD